MTNDFKSFYVLEDTEISLKKYSNISKSYILHLIYSYFIHFKQHIENQDNSKTTWNNPKLAIYFKIDKTEYERLKPILQDTKKETELIHQNRLKQAYALFLLSMNPTPINFIFKHAKKDNQIATIILSMKTMQDKEINSSELAFFTYVELQFDNCTSSDFDKEEQESIFNFALGKIAEYIPRDYIPVIESKDLEDINFPLPSHIDIMLPILAIFSGKSKKIPSSFGIPFEKRSEEQIQTVDNFVKSKIEKIEEDSYYQISEKEWKNKHKYITHIKNNEKIKAIGELTERSPLLAGGFIRDLTKFEEENLAVYITRTFGPEGLRHLLSIIIAMQENPKEKEFVWTLAKHFEIMGIKKKANGDYPTELKKRAIEILKIFSNFFIRIEKKNKDNSKRLYGKLLNIRYFEEYRGDYKDEYKFFLRVEDWWFKLSNPIAGEKEMLQYTNVLKSLVQEDHYKHPFTIFLAPFLSVWLRANPNGIRISVENLLNWCNIEINKYVLETTRELQQELDYMVERGDIGSWSHNGENNIITLCKKPLEVILNLNHSCHLKDILTGFKIKRLDIPKTENKKINHNYKYTNNMTKEELISFIEKSGLSLNKFAEKLGVNKSYISKIKSGKKNISYNLSKKIRELFNKAE